MRVNNKVKKMLSMNQYAKHAKPRLKALANRMLRRGEKRDIRVEQNSENQDGQGIDSATKVTSA